MKQLSENIVGGNVVWTSDDEDDDDDDDDDNTEHIIETWYRGLSARLQYLQCISNEILQSCTKPWICIDLLKSESCHDANFAISGGDPHCRDKLR